MKPNKELVEHYKRDLRSAGYRGAARALGFASLYHCGRRLDGSPEISHQIEIASYLRRVVPFKGLERALVVTMLHDVREDGGVANCVIRSMFGNLVAEDVTNLTKSFRGASLPLDYAFRMPVRSPVSAIVKGADRIHNLQTMDNAFSDKKKTEYRSETMTHIYPMLQSARATYPSCSATLTQIMRDIRSLVFPSHTTTYASERIPYDA